MIKEVKAQRQTGKTTLTKLSRFWETRQWEYL